MRRALAAIAPIAIVAVVDVASLSAHAEDDGARLALARQRFQKGIELFGASDWAGALVEFRASNSLYASPNSRLYIARCLDKLGKLDEAVTEYERTIGEGEERAATDPRYAEAAKAARDELAVVAPKIGRVRVLIDGGTPPGTTLSIAGRSLPPEALGLLVPVMPGRVDVRVSCSGYEEAHASLDVAAGSTQTLSVALKPLPPPPHAEPPHASPVRTAAFVSLGATAVFGATFGVLAWQSAREHDRFLSACTDQPCDDATYDGYRTRGKRLQTWTNVALGATAVAAATTITLFVIAPKSSAVKVEAGVASIGISGSF